LAAVEIERALSHLVWLRGFGVVLGWAELTDRAHRAALAVLAPHERLRAADGPDDPSLRDLGPLLEAAGTAAARLRAWLEAGRLLGARTAGRAILDRDRLAKAGVGGIAARAAGLARDARQGDPLYEALGFRVQTRPEGDAQARSLLRVAEAMDGLRLAAAALVGEGGRPAGSEEQPSRARVAPGEAVVEGPRGPLRATPPGGGRPRMVAPPGQEELLAMAGEAIVGLELAPGLVGLASFDLSGWRAAP
jgi:Ni,Fe-hydrogenase III large subunit